MGLAEYNRKRDFKKTAEPPGRLKATPTGNSFVIQKHAASRLHYDFRLELDGVLKSWSVPKGPSFDPAVKRLAVEVEDHPIDYGDFEGVIPAGEYGGGTVLLWDRGTWQPLSDAAKALAAGQLKFEVTGEKLRGRWVLVKIKERPGATGRRMGPEDRSWLLIKERDEHARPESEWNVVEARPESVATGRDLPAIASASDRVWHSNRGRPDPSKLNGARAAALPRRIELARAERTATVVQGDDWFHEVEIRGERLLCRIDAGHAELLGGNRRQGAKNAARGKTDDRSAAFPALVAAARALPLHDALMDGMATALGARGETSADRPADTFYVFDLMHLDGYDLMAAPLEERKALLKELVAGAGKMSQLRYVDHIVGRGPETFAAARNLGAPGLVSKRRDSRYRPGPRPGGDWRVVACGGEGDGDDEEDVSARGDAPTARQGQRRKSVTKGQVATAGRTRAKISGGVRASGSKGKPKTKSTSRSKTATKTRGTMTAPGAPRTRRRSAPKA